MKEKPRYTIIVKENESPREAYETQGLPNKPSGVSNIGMIFHGDPGMDSARLAAVILETLIDYGFIDAEEGGEVGYVVLPSKHYKYEIHAW